MKFYLKVFLIAFVGFSVLLGGGLFAYSKLTSDQAEGTENETGSNASANQGSPDASSELERAVKNGERINILLIGTDGGRSDTLMMASYDPKHKLADVISVPRDTYNEVEGRNAADQRKINAVYGFKGDLGGPNGLRREVSKILGVPIDYYVEVDYEAVAKVVDAVGGVEVEVPYKLDYDDNYCKPPLHIHIEPGLQKLDGSKALQFLRWRKNNDGSHSMGDLERIKRQQDFIKKAIKQAVGLKLPFVIKDTYSYIKTNMNLGDILYVGSQVMGVNMELIKTYTIPGVPEMRNSASYYIHNTEETLALTQKIYTRTPDSDLPKSLPGEPDPVPKPSGN